MYHRPIVPPGFTPPAREDGPGFHLRMLTIHDVVKDFDAVMAAGTRLHGVTEPGSTWPDGLTLEENLIDLAWHQREFTIGHSFAYTVMMMTKAAALAAATSIRRTGPVLMPMRSTGHATRRWMPVLARPFAPFWPDFRSGTRLSPVAINPGARHCLRCASC